MVCKFKFNGSMEELIPILREMEEIYVNETVKFIHCNITPKLKNKNHLNGDDDLVVFEELLNSKIVKMTDPDYKYSVFDQSLIQVYFKDNDIYLESYINASFKVENEMLEFLSNNDKIVDLNDLDQEENAKIDTIWRELIHDNHPCRSGLQYIFNSELNKDIISQKLFKKLKNFKFNKNDKVYTIDDDTYEIKEYKISSRFDFEGENMYTGFCKNGAECHFYECDLYKKEDAINEVLDKIKNEEEYLKCELNNQTTKIKSRLELLNSIGSEYIEQL